LGREIGEMKESCRWKVLTRQVGRNVQVSEERKVGRK
jgi:hypothetical protein